MKKTGEEYHLEIPIKLTISLMLKEETEKPRNLFRHENINQVYSLFKGNSFIINNTKLKRYDLKKIRQIWIEKQYRLHCCSIINFIP